LVSPVAATTATTTTTTTTTPDQHHGIYVIVSHPDNALSVEVAKLRCNQQ
jgi:hypothetical protein